MPTKGALEGVDGVKKLPLMRAGGELDVGEERDFALAARPEGEESTSEVGRPCQTALKEGLLMCGIPIFLSLWMAWGEAEI